MLEPALNVTLIAGPTPRDLRLVSWATPVSLETWVPTTDSSAPTEAGIHGDDDPTLFELAAPDGSSMIITGVSRSLRETLDQLCGLNVHEDDSQVRTSRSVRALAHLVRCALGMVERGLLHAEISDDDTDIWAPGPFDEADLRLVQDLGQWLPPELFCSTTRHGEQPDRALPSGPLHHPRSSKGPLVTHQPTGDDAVGLVYAAVADLMPRTAAVSTLFGTPSWLSSGHTDVSGYEEQLRLRSVRRRSILQLRLVLPDLSDGQASVHLFLRSPSAGYSPIAASDIWSGTVGDHLVSTTLPSSPVWPLAGGSAQLEEDLLLLIRRASRVWAPLGRVLDQSAPSRFDLDDDELEELIGRFAGDLLATGVEVMVPQELVRSLGGAPTVRVSDDDANGQRQSSGLFTIDSLCEVSWSLHVGGRQLSDEEVDSLIESKRRLIRLNDGWVLINPQVLKTLRESETVDATTALYEMLSFDEGSDDLGGENESAELGSISSQQMWQPTGADPSVASSMVSFLRDVRYAMTDETTVAPVGLSGELRPYQRAGLAWMSTLSRSGFGGILADDMGLGKTIQVIALHLHLRENPTDTPMPSKVEGQGATLVVAPSGLIHNWSVELARWAPQVPVRHYHGTGRNLDDLTSDEVVLTTYGILRRDHERIGEHSWGLVVADEAQAMKNRSSATARALRTVPSAVRFALTGTPVENHLGELWSIMNWTTPGLLGSARRFDEQIVDPINKDRDETARARLVRVVSPFMLRRTKSDPRIVPELPPRTFSDHVVPLTTEQVALYKAASLEILESVTNAVGIARRGAILKLLTTLKQISNHPAQFLDQDGPLGGRSGKFDLTMDLVDEIVGSGQSVVIFTQYVVMGKLLVAGLSKHPALAGSPAPQMLHGGVSLKERATMVDRFQASEMPVMVVSLRAGGVGLNLTAATHVIHFDRWWNPAVENQASDRVWRIGQDRPVQVHRLVSEGTVEERVAQLLESKQQLADLVLDDGGWLTELSDADLIDLVRLGSVGNFDDTAPDDTAADDTAADDTTHYRTQSGSTAPETGRENGQR